MAPFEDNAPSIVGTVATLTILGSIVLPLRIHVRASNHALGRDDWAMVAALVPWAALSIVCLVGAFHGVGVAEHKLTIEERQDALMVRSYPIPMRLNRTDSSCSGSGCSRYSGVWR